MLHQYHQCVQWYEDHRPRWLEEEPPFGFPLFMSEKHLFEGYANARSRMQGLLEELEEPLVVFRLNCVSKFRVWSFPIVGAGSSFESPCEEGARRLARAYELVVWWQRHVGRWLKNPYSVEPPPRVLPATA